MFKRNLWKIVFSAAVIGFCAWSIFPVQNRPFVDYAKSSVSAKSSEFNALIKEAEALAEARRAAGQSSSTFVALKQIANERRIDLAKEFFPHFDLGATKNIDRRNTIVLDHLLKQSKGKLQLGLDLKGGLGFTLELDEKAATASTSSEYERKAKLDKAIEILDARFNSGGVTEPIIRRVGENRIEVQLPGVNTRDNPEIIDQIKKPAILSFRLVHPQIQPSTTQPADIPPGYELMWIDEESRESGEAFRVFYVVKQRPEMTGGNIDGAQARPDQYGSRWEVHINFNSAGAKEFGDLTTANPGRAMGIVLDGKLYSAPRINEPITGGRCQITGSFDQREAENLAKALNNPLDVPLVVKEQYEVGPSLAEDAISSGMRAAVIGTTLVAAFMITFYSVGGLVAVGTLAINVLIILAFMSIKAASLTLPGLAGIVLTIGMAVDANILIFERMREELAVGKSLSSSNQSGYMKALTTIVDAHLVQLIICGVMIGLGTGPIAGFGWTLLFGVLSTLFSVLVTAHLVLEVLIEKEWIKKITMRRMLKDLHVDFVKFGKPAFIGSWIIVILGVAVVFMKGEKIYGIDFAGGDIVSVQFKDRIDTAKIRQVAKDAGVSEISPTYVSAIGGGSDILKIEAPEGKSNVVLTALQKAYPQAGLVKIGESHIGASIGKEIEYKALIAVGVSMLTILVYIAFRFEFGFGIGAMFSSLHDILMTIGIFVLCGHHFSAPMVAAILCIAGYSINETVVVFDRIREELRENPSGSLRDIVNSAINKVFARTIMTATTTFLAALALFIFGGGVLKDIAFTFLVGIVTSTFSAIFIAAQVFYWWHKGDRKHVEKHQDVKPTYEWAGTSKASQ
ncbi:MAG: protein translocase subunit SecD [Nibricoccus sp.]